MSLTADEGQKPGCELAGDQSGAKRIRQRVCKMSDAELLRFGMLAKYMCSQASIATRFCSSIERSSERVEQTIYKAPTRYYFWSG